MCRNYLQLNKYETEVTVFRATAERLKVSTQLQSVMLKTTDQARNLGVVMDSDLNLNNHMKTITKSAYYHLKNISRIKGLMSKQDLEKCVHAFIFSRLDHNTPVLRSLHWLPVSHRIDVKILLMVYKAFNGLGAKYISDLLLNYELSRPLSSFGTGLLSVPRVRG